MALTEEFRQAVHLVRQLVDCLHQLEIEGHCWCGRGAASEGHRAGCEQARRLVRQATLWGRRLADDGV